MQAHILHAQLDTISHQGLSSTEEGATFIISPCHPLHQALVQDLQVAPHEVSCHLDLQPKCCVKDKSPLEGGHPCGQQDCMP